MTKTPSANLILVLISLAVGFLLLELVAFALMESGFNGLPSRAEARQTLLDSGEGKRITLEVLTDTAGSEVLHPYLGFVMNRDKLPGINALGLAGSLPPERKDDSRLTIALLGGSVALGLKDYADKLKSALAEVPAFKGKEFVILPYGLSGGKQPQQLLLVQYLLALGYHLDVVINLDGFNELTLPLVDNLAYDIAPSYPRNWRLYSRLGLDLSLAQPLVEASRLQAERAGLKAMFANFPFSSSNAALWLYNVLDRRAARAFDEKRTDIEKLVDNREVTFQVSGPFQPQADKAKAMDAAIDLWIRSSVQLERLSKANGIRYFHFLQPNQYLEGSKPMSPGERAIAIRSGHPYGEIAAAGYGRMAETGRKRLPEAGVAFTDLTQLFKQEQRPVYKDCCCHFNNLGQLALIKAMAAAIDAFTATETAKQK